jgi:hypothetical protein
MNTAQLVHDISGSYDAFSRLRISDQYTLFDSKLLYDKQPVLWDDRRIYGTNNDTSSIHNSNQASVTMTVTSNASCMHVRQTYQRFSYQPGKSQMIMMTGVIGSYSNGIIKRLGCFDSNNGLFFQSGPDNYYIGKRSSTSGSPIDLLIPQEQWNKNRLDSQELIQFNLDKANIFYFNYEWLGVGDIFCGIALGAKFIPLHQFYNSNNVDVVTFSYPNLPLRYEITNTGIGPRSSLKCICSTVISEGGQQGAGYVYSIDRGSTPLTVNVSNTIFPLISIRLMTGRQSANVYLENLNIISTSNNVVFRWGIYLNPTFSSPITYTTTPPLTCVEYNNSTTNGTSISGGTLIYSGYGIGTNATILSYQLAAKFSLGTSIAGVSDVLVLGIQRLDNQNDVFYASLSIRESV